MGHLAITQVRSLIGAKDKQRRTIQALGLRRLHQTVVKPDRPEIRGMIAKVSHLVRISELPQGVEPAAKASGTPNTSAGG
jgi:large subunit ribosomal protein L30